MCGISGMFSPNGDVSIDHVREMNKKIFHRGPDNESYFRDDCVAFGHRRLSIIDLDERSNQPMEYGGLVIVFNGEIYNYQIVRQKLIEQGYQFKTNGDCEVVLKAFHLWGDDCVHYFKGMWSFAVYDKDKMSLFCSRDRFGIKPFYYEIKDGSFYFGSEIKQLTGEGCQAVMENIVDYIAGGYVDHNEMTFFRGIYQLPPSCNLTISSRLFDVKIIRYFCITDDSKAAKDANVKNLLDKSVSEHLLADVKIGSCLSGGLDSSYINYRVSINNSDSIAIHCNSSDHEFSEQDKAKHVAGSLGIALEIVEPTISEFKDDLDRLFYVQEHPFGDPSVYMQYCVMKKAKDLGIKVLLDGQGADEVFMGYSKYLGIRLWSDLSLFRFYKFLKLFWQTMQNNNLSAFYLLALMFGSKYERFKRLGLFIKNRIPLKHGIKFVMRGHSVRSAKAFQFSEIYEYPLQTLLRNEDRNSMCFSIEARVPYLDHELVGRLYQEQVVNKVSEGWSKKLLRDAAQDRLPNEIIYRKDKLGFNSPQSWLDKISYSEIYESKILKKLYGRDLDARWVRKLDSKMKWRLLSVAIWERVFEISGA